MEEMCVIISIVAARVSYQFEIYTSDCYCVYGLTISNEAITVYIYIATELWAGNANQDCIA